MSSSHSLSDVDRKLITFACPPNFGVVVEDYSTFPADTGYSTEEDEKRDKEAQEEEEFNKTKFRCSDCKEAFEKSKAAECCYCSRAHERTAMLCPSCLFQCPHCGEDFCGHCAQQHIEFAMWDDDADATLQETLDAWKSEREQ